MTIGELNQRVAFKRFAKTRRADGGYDKVSATVATRWAKVEPVAAKEDQQGGRMRGATSYKVTLRRYEGLTTEDHATWDGRDFNIREIRLPVTRSNYMVILMEAGTVL